jgi:hypothetical protein
MDGSSFILADNAPAPQRDQLIFGDHSGSEDAASAFGVSACFAFRVEIGKRLIVHGRNYTREMKMGGKSNLKWTHWVIDCAICKIKHLMFSIQVTQNPSAV